MRRSWLILPLLGIAGYFAVFGGEYSWLDVRRLERVRVKEDSAVRATQGVVKALRARADSLEHDSAMIERLAREQYGLIRPGERLYRFAGGADSTRAPGDSTRPATPAVAGSAVVRADSGAPASGAATRDSARRRTTPAGPTPSSRARRPAVTTTSRRTR